jgi:hypothetical protein
MKSVLAVTVVAGLGLVLGAHQWRLSRQLKELAAEQQALRAQQQQNAASLEAITEQLQKVRTVESPSLSSPIQSVGSPQGQPRLVALEKQVQALTQALARRGLSPVSIPAVPEYDPTQLAPPEPVAEPPTNSAIRGWSPEQVIGPPDTPNAGDCTTAWATREPDAGPEWLSVAFANPVEIAEVRVRESYNPGAIVSVAALVEKREVALWEGQAASGRAPRDFVVRAAPGVRSQNVIIRLDTASVPGWNEIDAVELVGRDGSRQWAVAASASSTYADRLGTLEEPLSPRFRLR